MKYLITGGCGFLGSNIAAELLDAGHEVFIFDNLSRVGAHDNLAWLQSKGTLYFTEGDVRDEDLVCKLVNHVRPNYVFHLAGQVAMTTSIIDPRLDFQVNVLGTLNVLEAIRKHSPNSALVYSSTNKVYGDLEQYTYIEAPKRFICKEKPNGFDEDTALNFHSPYGVSKGSADQYILDYSRIYGLNAVVFRHSSMFGGRQFATSDQGWLGWFGSEFLNRRTKNDARAVEYSGTGKQVRDILHANDCVSLYLAAALNVDKLTGHAFNIGGGQANSLSLLELFELLQELVGVEVSLKQLPARVSDQKIFVADLTKIQSMLDWTPTVNKTDGLTELLEWLRH